jgi:tetratricopeptide (TPR) repeat protein
METIDYDAYVERYVHGLMSEDERIWFEKELKDNPELNTQLAFFQNLEAAMNEKDVFDFREEVSQAHDTYVNSRKRRKLLIRTASIAAVLTGAVILVLALTQLNEKPYTNQEVYAMYYQPYQSTMTVRSGNGEGSNMFNQAINHYKIGEYSQAIQIFDRIIAEQKDNHAAQLYQGISNMEIKQFPAAERSFQSILDQGENMYVQQAEWYKGLCYLMMNRRTDAVAHFQKIAKGQGHYKDLAREVLAKLK